MFENIIQDASFKNKGHNNLLPTNELDNKECLSKQEDSRNKVKFLSRKILRFKTINKKKKN